MLEDRLVRKVTMHPAVVGAISAAIIGGWPGSALAKDFTCTAQSAAVFPGSRIHVRCSPADGAIAFFAFSIADPDSSRVLSLISTAVAARRPLTVSYDPNNLGGTTIGCLSSDCRLISWVELQRD